MTNYCLYIEKQIHACTHSIRAVMPGDLSVYHPCDASLAAPLCQHLTHSLARRYAARGSQLLLYGPLLGGTGQHRDRRTAGEHLSSHMLLATREHQPEKMTRHEKRRELIILRCH